MVSEPHEYARRLRKTMTREEDRLWQQLRGSRLLGAKFKRQVPIARYVVDFYCHAAKLVVDPRTAIRGDGKQHDWQAEYDDERTKALEAAGMHVMRFGNQEVLDDLDDVLKRIAAELRLPFD